MISLPVSASVTWGDVLSQIIILSASINNMTVKESTHNSKFLPSNCGIKASRPQRLRNLVTFSMSVVSCMPHRKTHVPGLYTTNGKTIHRARRNPFIFTRRMLSITTQMLNFRYYTLSSVKNPGKSFPKMLCKVFPS